MMVNGPEGGLEWDAVNWRIHEKNVAKLRQRIFTAVLAVIFAGGGESC
jgi:hypothetical protein